jgi:alkylation response protein AidB-like acyl-CoA dehydrogenase
VEFDFTAEQQALRDLARDLFEKESPPSRLRELWDGAERDPSVWRAMAGVGLTGLTIAEEHGGMGGDDVDLALVLEEAGRAALPEPLLETVGIAAPLLSEAGSPEQIAEWLPKVAAGEAIAAVVLANRPLAVDAGEADLLVAEAPDGAFHALPRGSFTATKVESEDRARRVYTVEFSTEASRRMPGDAGKARLRAAAGAASLLNGISMKLLEMTIAYVKTRNQFGRPVGSFQAVKHKLADAHALVESARAATWYAAYATRGERREVLRRRCRRGSQPRLAPGPRRDRLHLGARPAPVAEARQGAGAVVRIRRGAPPRDRGVAVRGGVACLTLPRRTRCSRARRCS